MCFSSKFLSTGTSVNISIIKSEKVTLKMDKGKQDAYTEREVIFIWLTGFCGKLYQLKEMT